MKTELAFQGAAKVIGEDVWAWMTSQKVMVVGLGGVGSWAVEALVRSGFRHLILMDLDEICVSNTNRQIHTLRDQVGKLKVHAMADRARAIHPQVEVQVVEDFLQKDNLDAYMLSLCPDVVIDAIDSLSVKCELANWCYKNQTKLFVAGSAGGKRHASDLRMADLAKSFEDDLLHKMRKRLRQKYGFPRGDKKFAIPCVFSVERKEEDLLSQCSTETGEPPSGRLDCQGGLGSLCHVTGSMGFLLVELVFSSLVHDYHKKHGATQSTK